ncbi:MAG TPA: hypothetical protein VJ938_06925 [Acidimicrobiia bacterium]|nr:hypothetical protein [Acidimicrobiia bacterium]
MRAFWWVRNRSIHGVGVLTRGYGDYEQGYEGSPPLMTRSAGVYLDVYTNHYPAIQVWGESEQIIERSHTDRYQREDPEVYDEKLAGREIEQSIRNAITALRQAG